jgi:hypothetical protein
MTRIESRKGSGTSDLGGLLRTESYDNEIKEVFQAQIKRIADQDIFIENSGKLHEFWSIDLAGPYHVGYRKHEVISLDLGDVIATTTETAEAAASPQGEGQTTLLLLDGKFEGLGPGGGVASSIYKLPLVFRNETTYRCKTPSFPCPPAHVDETKSSFNLFQGHFVGASDPKLTVTVDSNGLNLTWTRHRETDLGSGPPEMLDEEIVVTFRRAPQR